MHVEFVNELENYRILLQAELINKDLLVKIVGGDVWHLGTVTTYDKQKDLTETKRFFSHDERYHKDDVLASIVLEEIKGNLLGNCVILSGVHVNQITRRQIEASFEMMAQLAKQLNLWLTTHKENFIEPLYYKNSHEIDK